MTGIFCFKSLTTGFYPCTLDLKLLGLDTGSLGLNIRIPVLQSG